MEYQFWGASGGVVPVEDDIEILAKKDPDSAVKLIKKLENLDKYSFLQLRSTKNTVEHVRKKIWTLRYDLIKKKCRIYFKVDQYGTMQLLHLVIKKDWKLKPKDIDIAEHRGKSII